MVDLGLNVKPEPTWPGKAEADAFRAAQKAAKARSAENNPDRALWWIDAAEGILWLIAAIAVLAGLGVISMGGPTALAMGMSVMLSPVVALLVSMAILESLRFIVRKMDEYE